MKKTMEQKTICQWLAQRAATWKNRFLADYLGIAEPSEALSACRDITECDCGIHIGDVRPIAEAIGEELSHNRSTSDIYTEELSFYYDGVKFFSIYAEEELTNG